MYEKTTEQITVEVVPSYLEDKSAPDKNYFVWRYRVTIHNKSPMPVTLLERYWKITDNCGSTQEVSGEGVVGDQPTISPNQQYEYSSQAPLSTPGGIMLGRYLMRTENGKNFTVDIPPFSLDSPYQNMIIH